MDAAEWIKILVATLVGGLLGGGSVAGLLLGALETRLRNVFTTRSETNGLGGRVAAVEGLCLRLEERIGALETKMEKLYLQHDHEARRIAERLAETARTLERVAERVERLDRNQARLEGEREAHERRRSS
jgi:hypothetical protein